MQLHRRNVLSDQYFGSIKIRGFVNWQTKYSLEEYYRITEHNLFELDYEQENVEIAGKKAIRFK